jgi:hypothetical protein
MLEVQFNEVYNISYVLTTKLDYVQVKTVRVVC